MNIERDDCAERQARLDRMINEFREAQARRSVTAKDTVVESTLDAALKAQRPGAARLS